MLDFSTLPFPFTVLLYALTTAVFSLIFLLPLVLIFKTEITDFSTWWRENFSTHSSASTPQNIPILIKLSHLLSSINIIVGRFACWLVLSMVLMQFIVVVMRYVFSLGSVQMQESIWYMHGLIFTLGVGYTLYREGHVRIDVLYSQFSIKTQAMVNILGVLFFILPVCWVTIEIAYPYVANAWAVKEGSTEGTGLHYVYLIKTTILCFATLLLLQGFSLLLKSLHTLLSIKSDNTHSS